MEYMIIKEASEKWGLSAIPKEAERPLDKRIKSGKYIKEKF